MYYNKVSHDLAWINMRNATFISISVASAIRFSHMRTFYIGNSG